MEQQMIFSVSEANNFIKALLDRVPQLQEIFVRGEISNYKLYPSGHHYFTLKDAEGAMRCVLFKGNALRLRFRPENGMKVIAFGRISVFPRDGAYQLYVSELSPEGAGDLHVAFEQLKAQLEREGLFDPAHKKPLPKYPAILRDISLVVDEDMAVGDIQKVIMAAGGDLLKSADLFDIYRGPQVGEGKKSVAFALVYRHDDKTLTDEEVDKIHEEILKALKEQLDVNLRDI